MSDADYELWAAMMADDDEATVINDEIVAKVVDPVAVEQPFESLVEANLPIVIAEPEPVVEFPNFVSTVQDVSEPIDYGVQEETLGLSELAKNSVAEEIGRVAEFVPSGEAINDEEIEFPTNLFKEPQTNSITIPEIPDALNFQTSTDSIEILRTGAIDSPILSTTGSIPIISLAAEEIDEAALNADMGDETTGGIPPIRARSVMNSSAKVTVLPIRNRRGEGQTIMLATISILLFTLGAGVIALYMLEII